MALAPSRPTPELKLYVIRLLEAVDLDARLVMFEELPRRGYFLRLERRGELGKGLRFPMRLVDRAPQNRWAEQMLERILRSEVLALRSRDSVHQARLACLGLPPGPRSRPAAP
jgi:hypothetical protein